ncbi:hypothetical protein RHO15_08050 [Utexia brackfieldae]|uniref:hypothetical protein n=1 Tax=Utexia brackfieldae TaxID=3074108 RepID=UPI00370D0E64
MKKFNNTALVVLYKSKIMQSQTVRSLLNLDNQGIRQKIIIWNNGPALIENSDLRSFENICNEKNIQFEIYQDIRNVPLCHIYNFCLSKADDDDFFTILDQDSCLEHDFLTNLLLHSSYDLICPKIYDINNQNAQHYPFEYSSGIVFTQFEFDAKKYITIGSGLSLSKKLILKMIEKYGLVFDENFAFYFSDTELFFRFKNIDNVSGYCVGRILHSESNRLSYAEMSETTKIEMGYMYIINRIYKKNKKSVFKNLLFCFKYKKKSKCRLPSLFKLIKCVLAKKHPRIDFKIKKDFSADYDNKVEVN